MKRVFALLLLCAPLLCGCAKRFQDIRVTSYDIVSLSPLGLSAVEAIVDLGVYNPATTLKLSDISGVVKMNGDTCIVLTTEDIALEGRAEKVYRIPVRGVMGDKFNPFQLLTLYKNADFSQFTVDASAHAGLFGPVGKDISIKDLSLEKLLEKAGQK